MDSETYEASLGAVIIEDAGQAGRKCVDTLRLGRGLPRRDCVTGNILLGPFSNGTTPLSMTLEEWKVLKMAITAGQFDQLSYA